MISVCVPNCRQVTFSVGSSRYHRSRSQKLLAAGVEVGTCRIAFHFLILMEVIVCWRFAHAFPLLVAGLFTSHSRTMDID